MNDKSEATGSPLRTLQQRWRERLPELHRIVEDVSPRIWESAQEDRKRKVPAEWEAMVSAMRQEVHAEAFAATSHVEAVTDEERRGYHWSWKVMRVADMLEHLVRTIREDIGFEDHATLGSMLLLQQAALHLQVELQDGGTEDGREDRLENRYRVQQALRALAPRFDDVQMLRLRALQVADSAARHTSLPDDADIERRLRSIREESPDSPGDLERHREWMMVDQPPLAGVMARASLSEVDPRFGQLDPLVVLEEFAEASGETSGGRAEGGEGRTGPARALARLAVMCGALDFEQRDGEDFDAAAERARSGLLTARSRIRRVVREFPGQVPADGDEA